LNHAGQGGVSHHAVVCAVAAAAGGQRCVVAAIDEDRERSKTEEENEQNGECAPHLAFILHELWSSSRFEKACGVQVSSFHLAFPLPDLKG
jgi:hypothetical protein